MQAAVLPRLKARPAEINIIFRNKGEKGLRQTDTAEGKDAFRYAGSVVRNTERGRLLRCTGICGSLLQDESHGRAVRPVVLPGRNVKQNRAESLPIKTVFAA